MRNEDNIHVVEKFARGNYDDIFNMVHRPLSIHLELTYKCNLKCTHCYINQECVENELGLEQWKRACDIFISNGIFLFVISGGEPLVVPYFLELYSYLWNKGAKIIIFSNLLLLNEKHLNEFKKHPPNRIETSIYGSHSKSHEYITQLKGSFNLLIENVIKLKALGIPITLKTPVMKTNFREIDMIEQFVKKELACDYRYGYDVEFNGHNSSLILDENELLEFIKMKNGLFNHIEKLYKIVEDNNLSLYKHNEFQCRAGKVGIACDPMGNIKTCISDITLMNVQDLPIDWCGKIADRISKKIDENTECYSCNLKLLCEYCPARKEYDQKQCCLKAKSIKKMFDDMVVNK